MKRWLLVLMIFLCFSGWEERPSAGEGAVEEAKTVYIVPVRQDIMPPLVYVVRRGVKEAMEAGAELLLVDMETDGGRVDVTEEIIRILEKFEGQTVTYVNRNAFSAGAFIAVATQEIYMAPQSVIGAAAPIMVGPGGAPGEMPDTMEAKMTSAVRALVRAQAEKNGHNIDVVEAMIDKTKELKIDGEVLSKEGQILTLTNRQAEKEYGEPPRPLLSAGTVSGIEALLEKLGYEDAEVVRIEATGVEQLAAWINMISPMLLLVGLVGLYIEFKTPGFGIPGILGIAAFAIYFLGGYVAGLSGIEWIAIFALGVILIGVELFVFPGTIIAGVAGGMMILISLVMAMVDVYPGKPAVPTFEQLAGPLMELAMAVVGAMVVAVVLGRWLPRTHYYEALVSKGASGMETVAWKEREEQRHLGREGVTVSDLRPGGKVRLGERILDASTDGEVIAKGERVKVIGHSGFGVVVERIQEETDQGGRE